MKLISLVTILKCHKNDKNEIIKEHINNSYVSIKEKIKNASFICENTMFDNGVVDINSPLQYIYTCITIVQMFTDI